MDHDHQAAADARSAAAIDAAGIGDPRPFFRQRLRALRARDADAFDRAVRYYEQELLPRLLDPASDPVRDWLAYGRFLADLDGPGRAVAIDASGRARPAPETAPREDLILFLPENVQAPAHALAVPREASPAQTAALELLVNGKLG